MTEMLSPPCSFETVDLKWISSAPSPEISWWTKSARSPIKSPPATIAVMQPASSVTDFGTGGAPGRRSRRTRQDAHRGPKSQDAEDESDAVRSLAELVRAVPLDVRVQVSRVLCCLGRG